MCIRDREAAEGLVDADAGGPGHLGQVGLGQRQVDDRVVGGAPAILVGQIEQRARQPPRQVEEKDVGQLRICLCLLYTSGRLARTLLNLADQYGRRAADGTIIDLSLTQTDLAEMTLSLIHI